MNAQISGKNNMTYDAIIIGGGHNGLVTAATLAQNGSKVLVLERRETLGGAAATEEIFPGFRINTGAHDAGLFLPEIVHKLDLKKHGLEMVESPVAVYAPQPDGKALILYRDIQKSRATVASFSKSDAEKLPEFIRFMDRMAGVLQGIRILTPPDITQKNVNELLPWIKSVLKLKRLGKTDMMEFLRILPLSIHEFLGEWFESDALKGALGASGVNGSMQGPRASGTTFVMLYHYLGRMNGGFRASRFVLGGMGKLSTALANAARQHGAEIRTGAEVEHIIISDDRATGVTLKDGTEIEAKAVISNADPRHTFFTLVGAPNLGPEFNRKVVNIRFRGSTAKMNLALNGLPKFRNTPNDHSNLSGHIIICPSLEYLERAYDDAKYGNFSQNPYLDIIIPTLLDSTLAPEGKHVMSITVQYAPYHLKNNSWDEQRAQLGEKILNTISEYAPGVKELILHQQVLTPLDWEREYGLFEGSIFHGQMALDQLLFMRPVPGWGRYSTPIEGLYLCGAGTHPGGGVTGAPGFNAAKEVLKYLQ